MAEAGLENNEIKQRAVRRLVIAVVLVFVAVGILTYISYYKPAKVVTKPTPATLPPPPPPIVTGPEPAQIVPAQPGQALPELPPPPAPTESPAPAAVVTPTLPPPPPPSVTSKPLPQPGPGPKKSPPQTVQKPLVPAQNAQVQTPPAPPPPAVAAPKPSVTPPTSYVVQFGVFGNYENALQLAQKLKQAGIETQVETRVQLPAFKSKAEAEAALAKMRAKGITATIVTH